MGQRLGEALDAVVAEAMAGRDSLRQLAAAAGLDPATDFRNMDLRGLDLRDEDLTGFDFTGADLTGCDFRRTKGLDADLLFGARILGAIGLPEEVGRRRGPDGTVGDADGFHVGFPDVAHALGNNFEVRLSDGRVALVSVADAPAAGGPRLFDGEGHAVDGGMVTGWRLPVSPEDEPGPPRIR